MSPFDDLKALIDAFPAADSAARGAASFALVERGIAQDEAGLSGLYAWLAAWQGKSEAFARDVHLCLLASSYSHGAKPEVVGEMVKRTSRGRAVVSGYCVKSGLGMRVLELGTEIPHAVEPEAPNWTDRDCMATVAFGMEATAAGGDLLGLAGLAPGAKVPAQVMCSRLLDLEAGEEVAALLARSSVSDPFDVMLAFGGREVAAILGGMVAARSRRLPVLIEGWSALAAAAVLYRAGGAETLDHVKLAAYTDGDQQAIAAKLGLAPLLALQVGEGEGAALALGADVVVASTGLAALQVVGQ